MLCSRYEVSKVLVVRKRMMVDITALPCTALHQSHISLPGLLYLLPPHHWPVCCSVVLYSDNYLIKQFLSHLYKLASLSFNNIIRIILTRS